MIVTLTLNPGLDLTYALAESFVGEVDVHRAATVTMEASGKGVNVSRALHANGFPTVAVLPLGGSTGHHLAELLEIDGVPVRSVGQAATTRVNTTLSLGGGHTAKVNGPGGRLAGPELHALLAELDAVLGDLAPDGQDWLAVCGSLPPGVDPSVLGDVVTLAHGHGVRCAVDVSGPALRVALSAGADLLAPNRLELAEVDQRAAAATDVDELATVAAGLARDAGTSLLVSLGEDGALFTDGTVALHGRGPALVPVNTAGAGDALLSGWLARAAPPDERLTRAVRWSRATCRSATTVAPSVEQTPEPDADVTVRTLATRRPERSMT